MSKSVFERKQKFYIRKRYCVSECINHLKEVQSNIYHKRLHVMISIQNLCHCIIEKNNQEITEGNIFCTNVMEQDK